MPRLTIPISYQMEYVAIRRRTTERAWSSAMCEIGVKEIADADALLVARCANDEKAPSLDEGDRMVRRRADGGLREVRLHEGRFHVEVADWSEMSTLLTGGVARKATPFRDFELVADDICVKSRESLQFARRQGPLRKFTDDEGVAVAQRMQRVADKMFVLDGKVFSRCMEPVLVRKRHSEEVFLSMHYRDVPMSSWQIGRGAIRRLCDGAEDLLRDGGDLQCAFEVVRPEYLMVCETAHNVMEDARTALRKLLSVAHLVDAGRLRSVYRLRRALLDLSPHAPGPEVIAALAAVADMPEAPVAWKTAVGRIAETRPRERYQRPPRQADAVEKVEPAIAEARKCASDALQELAAAPADRFWAASGLPVTQTAVDGVATCEALDSPTLFEAAARCGRDAAELRRRVANGERAFVVGSDPVFGRSLAMGLVMARLDRDLAVVSCDVATAGGVPEDQLRTIFERHLVRVRDPAEAARLVERYPEPKGPVPDDEGLDDLDGFDDEAAAGAVMGAGT